MSLFDKLFGRTKKKSRQGPPSVNIADSGALMDEDRFWRLIHAARDKANGDFEQQQEMLAIELRNLSPDEIISFDNRFRYFRGKANTWELWGAIYIVHGGCSDDSFNDFREWLIGQGKDFYFRTTNDPETLVGVDTALIEDVEWEGMGYVPASVFEELTGQEMPASYREQFETTGKEWAEDSDDLEKMFPKLAAKYIDNI